MAIQLPKSAYKILLGSLLLAFTITACNNNGDDKKEKAPDTAAAKQAEEVKPAPLDTSKMDTATTRPVKTAD